MKNLSLTFCLAIAALLASVGSGFAITVMSGQSTASFTSQRNIDWTECYGVPRIKAQLLRRVVSRNDT